MRIWRGRGGGGGRAEGDLSAQHLNPSYATEYQAIEINNIFLY